MNTTERARMDAKYLRNIDDLELNATDIKAEFKDAPKYQGDLQGLKDHVKKHKAHFKDVKVSGNKVGAFFAFTPTTRRQRDWLAGKTGVIITKTCVYTFATRHTATLAYKELNEVGINSSQANWPIAIISKQL